MRGFKKLWTVERCVKEEGADEVKEFWRTLNCSVQRPNTVLPYSVWSVLPTISNYQIGRSPEPGPPDPDTPYTYGIETSVSTARLPLPDAASR